MLDASEQAAVISALMQGNSIRSVERMTGIHRDTIMRLMVRVADGCDRLFDEKHTPAKIGDNRTALAITSGR